MTAAAPFQNRTQFEKAIEKLIERADEQNRGTDLDRVAGHVQRSPSGVSRLTSLLMLVDDDFRGDLKAQIDAYRRFTREKGREADDDELVAVMEEIYRRIRRA
jgi:hypothetical protein